MKTFILIGLLCGIFSEFTQVYKLSKNLSYNDFSMTFALVSAITTFMELIMFLMILFINRPWLNHDAVLFYIFFVGGISLIKDFTKKDTERRRIMTIISGVVSIGCMIGLFLNIIING